MLTLRGRLVNVLRHQERTGRDGKVYPAYSQVQIMAEEPLQDGQRRLGIQTLVVETPDAFEALRDQEIELPIGVYVRSGSLAFFVQKGGLPRTTSSTMPAQPAASP